MNESRKYLFHNLNLWKKKQSDLFVSIPLVYTVYVFFFLFSVWFILLFFGFSCLCFHATYCIYVDTDISCFLPQKSSTCWKNKTGGLKSAAKMRTTYTRCCHEYYNANVLDFGDAISLRGRSIGARLEGGSCYPPIPTRTPTPPFHSSFKRACLNAMIPSVFKF